MPMADSLADIGLRAIGPDFGRRLWRGEPDLWKGDPHAIRERLGWLRAMLKTWNERQDLFRFVAAVRNAGVRDVVLLGMGGSSLFAHVCRELFPPAPDGVRLQVLDTTDPDAVRAAPNDPATTLYLVCSKSGRTVETDALYSWFEARGGRFAAITDRDTPLHRLAVEKKFFAIFLAPSDIGGRFSALSYFGMVPAALLGADLRDVLLRAKRAADACGPEFPDEENAPVHLGATIGAAVLEGRDKLCLDLSDAPPAFGLWLEQLLAESTGKGGRGIVPVRQWLSASGTDRFPCAVRLDHPNSIGAEAFKWMVATAAAAAVIGVNPFDEPDVAASKAKTAEMMARLDERGELPAFQYPFEEDGIRIQHTPAVLRDRTARETLGQLLEQAGPSGYFALLAYLPPSESCEDALRATAEAIERSTGRPVLTGYGPRYLHSTGQLFHGGPNTGVFFLFTADRAEDPPIPGRKYGFGRLELAQALGDFAAMGAGERRAVRFHLPSPGSLGSALRLIESALGVVRPTEPDEGS